MVIRMVIFWFENLDKDLLQYSFHLYSDPVSSSFQHGVPHQLKYGALKLQKHRKSNVSVNSPLESNYLLYSAQDKIQCYISTLNFAQVWSKSHTCAQIKVLIYQWIRSWALYRKSFTHFLYILCKAIKLNLLVTPGKSTSCRKSNGLLIVGKTIASLAHCNRTSTEHPLELKHHPIQIQLVG